MRATGLGLFVIAMVAVLPIQEAGGQAPVNDLARCEHLASQWQRYSNTGGESRQGSTAFDAIEVQRAVQDCRQGNVAAGINVLERKLRQQGFRF
jgi:hypothetical protein